MTTEIEQEAPPKTFISYSWTSKDHEDWVMNLATKLMKFGGVDVKKDKWDLTPGHDQFYFMEKYLNDPDINRVLCICDEEYVRKANERIGGAGAEAGMIAIQTHSHPQQEKFIPIILAKTDAGKPLLPVFLEGRIGIDFSDEEQFDERFRELVCVIWGTSFYPKPEVGPRPVELLRGKVDDSKAKTKTAAIARKVREALEQEKLSKAKGDLISYLREFSNVAGDLIVQIGTPGDIDDLVLQKIDEFEPYREEILSLFRHTCEYSDKDSSLLPFRDQMEKFLEILYGDNGYTGYGGELQFDAFHYVVRDLFLHFIALLISTKRIDAVSSFLNYNYFVHKNHQDHELAYGWFDRSLNSLDVVRNNKLGGNRCSVMGDEIKKRSGVADIKFIDLVQTDFILGLRSLLLNSHIWYPRLFIFAFGCSRFPMFAGVKNPARQHDITALLGIQEISMLRKKLSDSEVLHRICKWGNHLRDSSVLELMYLDSD